MASTSRSLRPFVPVWLATLAALAGCCPEETTEVCRTLDEWKRAPGCTAFLEATDGTCPDGEAVSSTCVSRMSGGRLKGDQCCYEFRESCE
jgi:hypothetical protein